MISDTEYTKLEHLIEQIEEVLGAHNSENVREQLRASQIRVRELVEANKLLIAANIELRNKLGLLV